jgi:SAM-dependent methyltransferase
MTAQSGTTARRAFYDRTGGGYESGRYGEAHMEGYRALRNDTLVEVLDAHLGARPAKVLEVGCGTGLSLQHLATVKPRYTLYGMDASETMLRQANEKGQRFRARPKLSLGDAGRLPFRNESFDAVFATRFIHQFPHSMKQTIWGELRRVVRRNGLLVVEFYARPYHWLRYYSGARKGRSYEDYFRHYPSPAEVQELAGPSFEVRPLRVPGARMFAGLIGPGAVRAVTTAAGRVGRGLLADEYFVVARK